MHNAIVKSDNKHYLPKLRILIILPINFTMLCEREGGVYGIKLGTTNCLPKLSSYVIVIKLYFYVHHTNFYQRDRLPHHTLSCDIIFICKKNLQ